MKSFDLHVFIASDGKPYLSTSKGRGKSYPVRLADAELKRLQLHQQDALKAGERPVRVVNKEQGNG